MSNKKKKVDLFFASLGNGTTVCDKNREKNNDYLMIAHISIEGEISWYDKQLPEITKRAIIFHAFECYGKTQFVKEQLQLNYPGHSITFIENLQGDPNYDNEFHFQTNYPFDTDFVVKTYRHKWYPNYAKKELYFTYTVNSVTA